MKADNAEATSQQGSNKSCNKLERKKLKIAWLISAAPCFQLKIDFFHLLLGSPRRTCSGHQGESNPTIRQRGHGYCCVARNMSRLSIRNLNSKRIHLFFQVGRVAQWPNECLHPVPEPGLIGSPHTVPGEGEIIVERVCTRPDVQIKFSLSLRFSIQE